MANFTVFTITRRSALRGAAIGAGLLAVPAGLRAETGGGGVVRVRDYSDLQGLDPIDLKAAPDANIATAVLPALVAFKSRTPEWEWQLQDAERVEQVSDTEIRFRLKDGLEWSNGFGPVTAEDVKFSYERIADPANESPYKNDWKTLDRVDVNSDDKLAGTIHLKEPFAPLWTSTLPATSGMIVCKAAVEQAGGRFTTELPAQCGPYSLVDWQPKQRTTLKRNPAYTGPGGGYEEIHILPIEDANAAEIAFEAGELDFTRLPNSAAAKYIDQAPEGTQVLRFPGLAYHWIGMNNDVAPFDNPNVRRAVQLAVDVDAILQAAYFGVGQRATGIVAPGLVGHREANLYARDVAEAKRLMEEAGLGGGVDVRMDVLNTTEFVTAAQIVQASLAEIGINVTVNQHDSGTFWVLGDQATSDQWDKVQLLMGRFSMYPDPAWATEWFTPEQVGVWNWERWRSPEFGELHAAALLEMDEAKRHDMYVRMQNLMEESGSYLFVTYDAVANLIRDGVDGAFWPDGQPVFRSFRPA